MKDKNFWVWGLHATEALVAEHPDSILELQLVDKDDANQEARQKLATEAKDAGVKFQNVERVKKEYSDKRHQGALALLKRAPTLSIHDLNDTLENTASDASAAQCRQWALLDRVEDPRNFGAILRSAAAFGLSGVFFGQKQQAPVSGVVAQSSAGQCFRVPLYELSNVNQVFTSFASSGRRFVCASLDMDGEELDVFAKNTQSGEASDVLWVLGSEGRGVRPGLLERSTDRVKIPMSPTVESLNVSVASALAFYSLRNIH